MTYVGGATDADGNELILFVNKMKVEVKNWMFKAHSEFMKTN